MNSLLAQIHLSIVILLKDFCIFLFDVLNPKQILEGGKPSLMQRGPFTYRQVNEKKNVIFVNENKMSYTYRKTYYFERDLSNGSESDTLTFMNVPAMVIQHTFINTVIFLFSNNNVSD